jgi:hypothetical protein
MLILFVKFVKIINHIMKKNLFLAPIITLIIGATSFSQDQFTIQIEPLTITNAPNVHSFSWGKTSDGKWVIFGATIEDLDIVDLQKYISETQNAQIISVYQSLQCGSRNHLRSFTGSLVFYDATYTPQFLSLEEYNSIVNSTQEQCR